MNVTYRNQVDQVFLSIGSADSLEFHELAEGDSREWGGKPTGLVCHSLTGYHLNGSTTKRTA